MSEEVKTRVKIFTTRFCGYCYYAKDLLESLGIAYREVDVSRDPAKRAWMVEKSGRTTVPQIFIDGNPIGGYTELAQLHREGILSEKFGL